MNYLKPRVPMSYLRHLVSQASDKTKEDYRKTKITKINRTEFQKWLIRLENEVFGGKKL